MKSLIFLLLSGFCLMGCQGQQVVSSGEGYSNATVPSSDHPSAPKNAKSGASAYTLVEGLIKDPAIVERSWSDIKRALPEGCQQSADSTEVTCPPIDGVTRISVMASGSGIVEVVMSTPATCEELRSVVIKRFGPAKTTSANGCSGDWDLRRYMKTGYLRIAKGKKDPAKVSLQFGVEQGP